MRTHRRGALAALTVLAVTAAVLGPAGAGSPAAAAIPPPAVDPAPLAGPPAGGGLTTTVLLISGDQVSYTAYPDSTGTVAVSAADRPDGRPVAFELLETPEGQYVIPTDAWPLLAAGTLDRELFNVTTLVRDGLAGADHLPVIVTGPGGGAGTTPGAAAATAAGAAATALAATGPTTTLESIGGAAAGLDGGDAATIWAGLTGGSGTAGAFATAAGEGTRIWLDRAMEVSLDESVPQIGAPEVWDAGFDGSGVTVAVLDTGIDPDHPDLAGRVVGTANFTPDPFRDGHGHGTHVASIAAGSGAASGGTYRGVAPGAELLVGKVIPDSGTGPTSAVIDGMEWAAHAGADIVNLSVGGPVSDGTDRASLAADSLTAETGTLFVVASGNNLGDAAVQSPAAAGSALAVGSVNDADALVSSSNRGPRRGDAAVKPELTAPGDGIVAARAAGTSLGTPVDDRYTRVGGTSMATPHVAGSAALLAQAHPDWDWRQLKDALVSTAVPGDYSPFQGGAGRLDVAAAVAAGVTGPASANAGAFPAPYDERRTEALTYHNHTDVEVTLELALSGRAWTGDPLPEGAVSLGAPSVTVPAGGTATATLTVDAGPGDVGAYTGVVTATGGGLTLRTPFGYYKSTGSNELTIRAVDFRGEPATGAPLRAVKLDGSLPNDPFHSAVSLEFSDDNGEVRFQVADGLYDVYGQISNSWDLHANRLTSVVETEREITGATTVALDGGEAVRVDPHWPERIDLKAASASYRRGFVDGEFGSGWAIQYSPRALYMQPAEYTTGWLEVVENWQVASALVETAEVRAGGTTLPFTPGYHNFNAAPRLAGEHDLEVVSAGTGTPAELAAADVAGRVGLVRIPVPADPQPNPPTYAFRAFNQIVEDALAQGAAGLLAYVDEPGSIGVPGEPRSTDLLELSVPYDQGEALRALLAEEPGPARLTLVAERDPDRIYRLREWHEDPGLPDPRRQVDRDELVAVETRYHADGPDLVQRMFSSAFTPRERTVAGLTPSYWAPFATTEYILPGAHLRWHRQAEQRGPAPGRTSTEHLQAREMFLPGDVREPEVWFQSPVRTGAADVPHDTQWSDLRCSFCRQGDSFIPGRFQLDSDPRHSGLTLLQEGSTYRMFRGEEEIPHAGSAFFPRFTLAPDPATYRLELAGIQSGVPQARTLAPRIHTAWTFTSARPAAGVRPPGYTCPSSSAPEGCAFQPLLRLDWQLGLDLQNRAQAGTAHTFGLTVAPHSRADQRLVRGITPSRVHVWYSTDEGETWQEATVRGGPGRGGFRVTVDLPELADTSGFVWLRADARDVAGTRVEQTIERAYALR